MKKMGLHLSLFQGSGRKLFNLQLRKIFYCICRYAFSSRLLDSMEQFYHLLYWLLLHTRLIKTNHMFLIIVLISLLKGFSIFEKLSKKLEIFNSSLLNLTIILLNVRQKHSFFDPIHDLVMRNLTIFFYGLYPSNKIYNLLRLLPEFMIKISINFI